MRKTVSVAMALMVLAGTLTACGSSAAPAASTDAAASQAQQTEAVSTEKAGETAKADATAVKTATGKFTVGFDQEFPPMGFVGDNGEYTGYDLDLAKEVAKRLNLEFVPQPINWDSKDMELDAGNIDCIWNGFTMQGREDAYTWVGPYMANNQVFVVNEDSDVKKVADLSGKAVEVQKDSSGLAALKDNPDIAGTFGSMTEVADYNTALMDLESGAADAVCMDSIVAGYQITKSGKKMRILDEVLAAEEYGIGFKKDNTELADAVKKTLLEMKADGTVKEISDKWFGSDVFTLK